MPHGCGTWPAFWTVGDNWPNNGEIDIIENVNEASINSQTLHTNAGCTQISESSGLYSGIMYNSDCNAYANGNAGCSIIGNENSFGANFNSNGGGVYAMEWTSNYIRVFFFSRANIPLDIMSGNPNPDSWGKPVGYWTLGSNCPSSHFHEHFIIFDTTFCGDWAGSTFATDCPAYTGQTCASYVQNNPAAFRDAYWFINSLKVYHSNVSTICTTQDNDPYSTGSFVPCCSELTSVLSDWNSNGNWYYLCKAPSPCTSLGNDPYATGSLVSCCAGLGSVLKDWNNNGNYFYMCMPLSVAPTKFPSKAPEASSSYSPSQSPTSPLTPPSVAPSLAPTISPSRSPSRSPTSPTTPPSAAPTVAPTISPSRSPTRSPTSALTRSPK